jgi:hypothetical protein
MQTILPPGTTCSLNNPCSHQNHCMPAVQSLGVYPAPVSVEPPPLRFIRITANHRCRANMAHIRQSRLDYGLGFRVKGH